MMRTNADLGRSSLRREGLLEGEAAPDFDLPGLDGGRVRLEDYRGFATLVLFSDPECGPCNALLPILFEMNAHAPDVRIVIVSRGTVETNLTKFMKLPAQIRVGVQTSWEVSRAYAMFAVPIAYFVDEDGRIGGKCAAGPKAILDLLLAAQIRALIGFLKALNAPADSGNESDERASGDQRAG